MMMRPGAEGSLRSTVRPSRRRFSASSSESSSDVSSSDRDDDPHPHANTSAIMLAEATARLTLVNFESVLHQRHVRLYSLMHQECVRRSALLEAVYQLEPASSNTPGLPEQQFLRQPGLTAVSVSASEATKQAASSPVSAIAQRTARSLQVCFGVSSDEDNDEDVEPAREIPFRSIPSASTAPHEQLPEQTVEVVGAAQLSWCEMHSSPAEGNRRGRLIPSTTPIGHSAPRSTRHPAPFTKSSVPLNSTLHRTPLAALTPLPPSIRNATFKEAHDLYFASICVPETFEQRLQRSAEEARRAADAEVAHARQVAATWELLRAAHREERHREILSEDSARQRLVLSRWQEWWALYEHHVGCIATCVHGGHGLTPRYDLTRLATAPTATSGSASFHAMNEESSIRQLMEREQSLLWLVIVSSECDKRKAIRRPVASTASQDVVTLTQGSATFEALGAMGRTLGSVLPRLPSSDNSADGRHHRRFQFKFVPSAPSLPQVSKSTSAPPTAARLWGT